MAKPTMQVGLVEADFGAKRIAVGGDALLWTNKEGQLWRSAIKGGKVDGDRELLAEKFDHDFIATADLIIYKNADSKLTARAIDGRRLGADTDVDVRAQVRSMALDGEWFYFADDKGSLRRSAVKGNKVQAESSVVAEQWDCRHFTAHGGRICWLEGSILKLANIDDGKVSSTVEVLSADWKSPLFSGSGDQLFWIDVDGGLKRGKKLAANGNYMHFSNRAFSWDRIVFLEVTVWQDITQYYKTSLSRENPTGTPYGPKLQDKDYTVRYRGEYRSDERAPPFEFYAQMEAGRWVNVKDASYSVPMVPGTGSGMVDVLVAIEPMG